MSTVLQLLLVVLISSGQFAAVDARLYRATTLARGGAPDPFFGPFHGPLRAVPGIENLHPL